MKYRNVPARIGVIVVTIAFISVAAVAATYKWTFTNPNDGQVAAYRVSSGILTVASVRTISGCQTPFLVPERTPFLYDLKIRTATGPIFCTQIVKDQLVAFYEAGKASSIHVKTLSGTVSVQVHEASMRPPSP